MLPVSSRKNLASVTESTCLRLMHTYATEFGQATRNYCVRVFPNPSRVDSSNLNPQEFWNNGVQMVCLNYQTPGLMMDLQVRSMPAAVAEFLTAAHWFLNTKTSLPGRKILGQRGMWLRVEASSYEGRYVRPIRPGSNFPADPPPPNSIRSTAATSTWLKCERGQC